MRNYKLIALILLGIGCLLLAFESYKFYSLTSLITDPNGFDEKSANITSAIGTMIGGTVGVIFSLVSVIFFVFALESQKEESKILRVQTQLQALETSVFNLFAFQNDIRKLVSERNGLNVSTNDIVDRPTTLSNLKNTKASFESLFTALKSDSNFFLGKSNVGAFNYFATYIIYMNQYNWKSPEEMLINYYQIDSNKLVTNGKSEVYKRFFGEFRSVIGHYCRNLYHILKYLFDKEQEEKKSNKNSKEVYIKYKRYADLLQAQMSTDELLLCFYNGLIFRKAKFLYQYYDFLENINIEELIDKEDAELYSESLVMEGITANPIIFKSKIDWEI